MLHNQGRNAEYKKDTKATLKSAKNLFLDMLVVHDYKRQGQSANSTQAQQEKAGQAPTLKISKCLDCKEQASRLCRSFLLPKFEVGKGTTNRADKAREPVAHEMLSGRTPLCQ